MVKGILADINAQGQVEYLVQRMQAEPWTDFWKALGVELRHFNEVGLSATSSDLEIWQICQKEQLILITDNRNLDSKDSLEATIREYNTSDCLPVFTIADLGKFRNSRSYADRVLEMLYEYLLRIDTVRGTGRLYLP
jgi:hypothetical protein